MKKKKTIIIVSSVAILIIAMLIATGGNELKKSFSEGFNAGMSPGGLSTGNVLPSTSQETITAKPSSTPSPKKDKLVWADTKNYSFAVDIADYPGDVVPAGDYYFHETTVQGTVPVVYDVYVSPNLYNKLEELNESELIGSVGGTEKAESNTTLKAGSYVYIKYNDVLGKQGSMLEIEQK